MIVSPWPRSVRIVARTGTFAVEYTARSFASLVTPLRLILTVMAVLSLCVGLSALTTRDRMWWAVAFSNLGVFNDGSSLLFNGGLIAAGAMACVFAHRLRLDLHRLGRRMPRAGVHVIPGLCAVAGVAIMSVGVFTETANRAVHDLSASTLALSFVALVLTGPWLLRGLSPVAHVVTAGCSLVLFTCVGIFVAGALTLAAFELVLFGLFFVWLCTVSAEVERARRARR